MFQSTVISAQDTVDFMRILELRRNQYFESKKCNITESGSVLPIRLFCLLTSVEGGTRKWDKIVDKSEVTPLANSVPYSRTKIREKEAIAPPSR